MNVTVKNENGVLVYRDSAGNILTVNEAKAAAIADPTLSGAVNERNILDSLKASMAKNKTDITGLDVVIQSMLTFLAIPAPTSAERNAAIVDMAKAVRDISRNQKDILRQLNSLERLALRDLTGTD